MREFEKTGTYTDSMEDRIYDVYLDEDPATCRKQLLDIAGSFRPMHQVLEELLVYKGFSGDRKSIDEKYAYARMLFITKGVPVPRNLKAFLEGTARFDRDKKTPFQFCVAFGLTVEEAEVFFRRCCLGRGFDYHSMQDFVYAFGLKKGMSYQEICDLLEQLPAVKQGTITDFENALYTEDIVKAFDSLDQEEEVVAYLKEHADRFAYNNATACKRIREIWQELTDISDGLLNKELRELSDISMDKVKEKSGKRAKEIKAKEKTEEKYIEKKRWAEETALKQMLGLDDAVLFRDFSNKRSLKEILKDNPLLHPLAADCFPNRNAVRSILDGKHVSYESVRKLLILLLFYRYWIKKALALQEENKKSRKKTGGECKNYWQASGTDGARCLERIDSHLNEAGYPGLYYGNPYDWLFLFAMANDEPLPALRDFMQELYLEVKDHKDGSA